MSYGGQHEKGEAICIRREGQAGNKRYHVTTVGYLKMTRPRNFSDPLDQIPDYMRRPRYNSYLIPEAIAAAKVYAAWKLHYLGSIV
jgi:hypothetical protein